MNEQPEHSAADQSSHSVPVRGGRLRQFWRFLQVRARFVAALALIAFVVGQWERVAGYWDLGTRFLSRRTVHESAVSADTEFFCPMDPGVISAWEDKCPICNMTLVRRSKSDARLLPEGVVARMQFSPYRLQLAGIQTAEVSYRALVREVEALGIASASADGQRPVPDEGSLSESRLSVEISLSQRDACWVAVGSAATITVKDGPDGPIYAARVTSVHSRRDAIPMSLLARLAIDEPGADLAAGNLVCARLQVPLAELEPYRSLPRKPPPLRKQEVRVAYVSVGHPEILRDKPGLCPLDGTDLIPRPLAENQRLSWWCPMHPEVVADEDGHECEPCDGMKLLPRIVTYSPPGQVLAVPQTAVIHTGEKDLVYVEAAPGMFDGIFVELGARCGNYYPVLKGLEAGQRVAAQGAFLIDAETRLSGDAATAYFGASGGK